MATLLRPQSCREVRTLPSSGQEESWLNCLNAVLRKFFSPLEVPKQIIRQSSVGIEKVHGITHAITSPIEHHAVCIRLRIMLEKKGHIKLSIAGLSTIKEEIDFAQL